VWSFSICILLQILFAKIKVDEKKVIWKICGRIEVCTGFCSGNLKEGDNFEELRADARIILKIDILNGTQGRGLDTCGSG
jgi:hypothetical protein